jgi:DNA polymerase-3 subunit epsilon
MAKRPIYYDTETTGIKAERDRVIEIAAFDPVLNRTFEKLINPGIPIPAEATAIHKITDEMVASSPSFSVIVSEFIDFCDGDTVLIAHNNDGFDFHFLKHEFERCSLKMPEWQFLDTLKWARKYRPDLPRHSLQFLRDIYGIPANNAHRALDDVVVLHQVFSFMLDDLSIDQALSLLKGPREFHMMPFGKYQGKPLAEIPKDYVQWLAKSGAFDKPENEVLRQSFQKVGSL